MWFRSYVATILQITGFSFVALGVGIIFVPAGIIVAGIGLVLFGLAMERNN